MVRWLHGTKQKAYKKPITHTWKRNRRSWRYSANMSSIRTICEKIRTRWPVSFNLHSSLSSRNSFPLPRIRVCWKRITRRSHQGYESAWAIVFRSPALTSAVQWPIYKDKDVYSVSDRGGSEENIQVLPTRAVKTGNNNVARFEHFTDLNLFKYAVNVIHHHYSMVLIFFVSSYGRRRWK